MRNRPFFVLVVVSLFVALRFTVVGLPGGEPVRAVSPDSSVSDAQGDVLELRLLLPAPDPRRDLTIEGNRAKVIVPRWVVGYPQSFQWVGSTLSIQQKTHLDVAPDFKVLNWTRGATSEGPDAQNPELLPYEDLTYVRLRELTSSQLEFLWRCRGDIPVDAVDVGYSAVLAENLVSGPEYVLLLAPSAVGWTWFVNALGETRFPWDTASYEDILSASVSHAGDGHLLFEMTTAQNIPAVPAEANGSPGFSWILRHGTATVGEPGDLEVFVRWDAESSQWEGAVMGWDGQDYVDLDIAVAFTLSDATVSATVEVADLGLQGTFSWQAMTGVRVGPDEEPFVGLADQAPDSGWVEDIVPAKPTSTPTDTPTATPTPPGTWRIYLPVIFRGVRI
jgi:hypothetical protein